MYINYKEQNIFAFSDTHGMHRRLAIPEDADILVCAGDGSSDFSTQSLTGFLEWYAHIPAKLRIFIAGNHELVFDYYPQKARRMIPDNIVYMEDSGIEYNGISFYSVSASALHKATCHIPVGTDFLITHFPPLGILDDGLGNEMLRDIVFRCSPKFHLFGHIHARGGESIVKDGTTFRNVSYFNQLNEIFEK